VDVVSRRVDHDSDLVRTCVELLVVGSSAHASDGAVDVIVHPPVTLVMGVLPHANLTWVVALSAAVTVGVAEHDVPFTVALVTMDSEVLEVNDSEVSVIELFVELNVTVVNVTVLSAIFVVEHTVPHFAEELGS